MAEKDNESQNGWNEWSRHVLKELERLNSNYESLSKELQKTNQELTRQSGLRYAIKDLEEWKDKVEAVTTPKDLEKMKADVENLGKFRTQVYTIGFIVNALMALFIAFKEKIFGN